MRILDYEHVGIRVSDRAEAITFYEKLGFKELRYLPEHQANEMASDDGVYLNLIFNAIKRPGRKNVLYDEVLKYPGITHPAFVVDDLDAFTGYCRSAGIAISDGPMQIGHRRRALFLRDPDGNVLEFDEISDS